MEPTLDLVLAREEGKKIVYPDYPTIPHDDPGTEPSL